MKLLNKPKTTTKTERSSSTCATRVVPTHNNSAPSRISVTRISSSSSDNSVDENHDTDTDISLIVNMNGFVRQGLASASSLLKKTLDMKARRKYNKNDETARPVVIHPSLHMFPDTLHPYYQSLPPVVQVINLFLATLLVALSTRKQILRSSSFLLILRRVFMLLFKSLTLTLVGQCCLQEIFKNPSRISMHTLLHRYFLPSSLSRYSKITIPEDSTSSVNEIMATKLQNGSFSLGVHYLKYDNNNGTITNGGSTLLPNRTVSFDAMYFQHGFGASSLSWLPLLVPLANKLGSRIALGHDAVGFGFTDRPKDTKWYTSKQSARIAKQILLQNDVGAINNTESKVPPVVLVGHSMGSLSILRLATELPRNMPKLIILSSPALGFLRRKKPSTSILSPSWISGHKRVIGSAFQHRIARPVTKYILRRAVGTKNSWSTGLSIAYGNKNSVTESDILRYSWPAIGYGWEDGLLNFAAAQQMPEEDELDDDTQLLSTVLKLPDTKLIIILGSKDKVVPSKHVHNFVDNVRKENNNTEVLVPIVEMEGLGHCAFEEDSENFCAIIGDLINDHWN